MNKRMRQIRKDYSKSYADMKKRDENQFSKDMDNIILLALVIAVIYFGCHVFIWWLR